MVRPEEQTMIEVLLRYIRNLPAKKLELTLQTLALDAEYYRSARLKGTRFEGRFGADEKAALAKVELPKKKARRRTE